MNVMHVCITWQSVAVGRWANLSSMVKVNVEAPSDVLLVAIKQATDVHRHRGGQVSLASSPGSPLRTSNYCE